MMFSKDFLWGVACASYQCEGAWDEDGKGRSIWDDFSHIPGKVFNNDNGDRACDTYHRWAEDVALMKQFGIQAYRFSINWARIIPDGDGPVNEKGFEFYDNLVNALLDNGIKYTATIGAGKRIKNGQITLHIAVADSNGQEYDWQEFSLATQR